MAAEVAQVYVSRYHPTSNSRAVRVSLAAFYKTSLLGPGDAQNVSLVLNHRSLSEVGVSVGEISSAGWLWTPGVIRIWIGGRSPTVEEIEGQKPASGLSPILYTEVMLQGTTPIQCPGSFNYTKINN